MNWTEEDLELLEYPPILRQPLPCKDRILSTRSPLNAQEGFCHLLSFPVEPRPGSWVFSLSLAWSFTEVPVNVPN